MVNIFLTKNLFSMKRVLLIVLCAICIGKLNAQSSSPEIVSSAGATFQGNAMQIDWTLGELAITNIQNSSQRVTQGFHQSSYTITSVRELPKEVGQIRVYPIPTSDWIEMELNFDQTRNIRIQLIDNNGRLLWNKEENGAQIKRAEKIKNLSSGTYFINFIIDAGQYSQTFKIQKLN